jgi:ATP-binding cassette subfamily C protein CydCD
MISGVVVGSLTAVLILCQAKLLSTSISSVFSSHAMTGMTRWLVLLALVLIGRGVLGWASSWLAQRTAAAVKSQLRRDILSARLSSPANQTTTSSPLVTLVTQGLDALDGYFSKYLPQLLLACTVPLIVGAAILFSDWKSALIIAATIPFIPVLMALVGWTTEKQVTRRWKYQSRLASHFADLVAGLPTLQVFGRARAQIEGLRRTEDANRRETMGILRISFLSAFVLELFSTIAVAVVALVIGTRLVYGQMDFATALFVLILAPEVYLPIRQVGVHYHDSADGLAAAEAAFAEIDRAETLSNVSRGSDDASGSDEVSSASDSVGARPASANPHTSSGGPALGALDTARPSSGVWGTPAPGASGCDSDSSSLISARNITYTYPGTDTAIGPFNLEVRAREIVALAGRSGGGKTTLLNCVLGFLAPDGDLVLSGQPFGQVDWVAWRAGLAYVPQTPGMMNGTIADNVRLGYPDATDEQVHAMLDRAGAGHLDQTRTVGEEGESLSVGERRRVGIARALARIELGGARLLILDEPTAGLDADTEAKVLLSLKESGATALVVSHREAVIEAADRVIEVETHAEPAPSLTDDLRLADTGVSLVAEPNHSATALESEALDQPAQTNQVTGTTALENQTLGQTAAAEAPAAGSGAPQDPQGRPLENATEETEYGPRTHGGEPSQGSAPEAQSQSQSESETKPQAKAETQSASETKPHAKSDTEPETKEDTRQRTRKGSPLLRLVTGLLDAVPGARSRLLAAVLLAAAASGAAVALMGVSAWLISKAAQHPYFLELSVAAVGVRFFGISRGVFRYVERLVGHDIALRMQSALRLKTYSSLARTTLLGRRQGDLLVRVVSDVEAIEDVVVRILQPFVAAALVIVGVCAMIARFSMWASLAILVSAILGGIVVPWLTARVSLRSDEEAVPLRGELGMVVHDLSRTAIDLAAYNASESALGKMSDVDLRLRRTEERAAWAQGIGNGLQIIAAGLGVLGGLWIGADAVCAGTMGDRLLAVMVLTPLALHEVFANFTQAAQTMTRAKVALGRVMDIIDAPAIGRGDVVPQDADVVPSIHCESLTIGWPLTLEQANNVAMHGPSDSATSGQGVTGIVASGLTIDVGPGEAVGVMGPSGIGKTTLAATIMGLIPPVSGDLETTGRIGYLAQDAHIFATSVSENVRIGNKGATEDEVVAALAEAGLSLDPERQIGEMGSTISGGEARRLALARLLVGDYRLLILDEPTEHLDRETADALMDDLFATVGTRPLLVITHDESVAARCDRVLTMG